MYKPALLTVNDVKNFIFEAMLEMPTEYLNQKQLARRLNLSRHILEKCLDMGMPYELKGKRKLYRLNVVRKWLVEHEMLGESETSTAVSYGDL